LGARRDERALFLSCSFLHFCLLVMLSILTLYMFEIFVVYSGRQNKSRVSTVFACSRATIAGFSSRE